MRPLVAGCVIAAGLAVPAGRASATPGPCFPVVSSSELAAARAADKLIGPVKRHVLHDFTSSTPGAGSTKVVNGMFHHLPSTLTETRNADGSLTEEFDLGLPGASFEIWSASAALETAGSMTQTNEQLQYDFDALHAAVPTTTAAGALTQTFTLLHDPTKPKPGIKKTETVNLVNFIPEEGDPHGPRNGSFTHVGEPGVGGVFSFSDSLVLIPCPPNPSNEVAQTKVVARSFKDANGKVHGRSDTEATGGQIPNGDTFVSLGCGNSPETTSKFPVSLDKEEESNGNTIVGQVVPSPFPPNPCDPAFGTVPSLNNNATDYDFAIPPTFPNEW